MPRVVYWDNIPAPYAVERYNELAERGSVDFRVWFARQTDPDRSWDVDESSWRFHGEYVDGPLAGVVAANRFVTRLEDARPDLLLTLYGEPQFAVGLAMAQALGIRTAMLALPSYDTWVRRRWWRELAKHLLFRAADAVKVSGPDAEAYAARYGCPPERTFRVTQSSNVRHFAQPAPCEAREALRSRMGLTGCVFLCVSRFWRPKGVFVLLDAFSRARAAINADASLLLIGDGPDGERLAAAAGAIPGVVIHPFVQAPDLSSYYAASDVFVFPTLGDPHGQVVEEAHAAGLPVIATDAAGDISMRVTDGVSGLIVPAGDVDTLARSVTRLALSPDLRASMGREGRARVARWNHDTWATDFEHFVAGAIAVTRRRTAARRMLAATGRLLLVAINISHRARTWRTGVARDGLCSAMRHTLQSRFNRLGLSVIAAVTASRRESATVKKLGTEYGGWLVPLDALSRGGVCYCAGVGEDTSFEDALLRQTPCSVWSFDPTPRAVAHVQSRGFDGSRYHFRPLAIWDRATRLGFYPHRDPSEISHSAREDIAGGSPAFEAQASSIDGLMEEHGHSRLALLKLNIEGAEWRVIPQLLERRTVIDTLCVEFCGEPAFWRVYGMMRRLRTAGYEYLARTRWKFTFVRSMRREPATWAPVRQPHPGR